MPKSKKQRVSKTSSGKGIKHKKSPQTQQALIMMNKGMIVNFTTRIRHG